MPRGPRIDFPGAIHHVYARGIEKRELFFDDIDRDSFLHRVGANLPRWGIRCPAWSLMPNHFHLILQSDTGSLASFMQCLLTGYSKYFNERHNRVGHLFQNRYKSPTVDKAKYFLDVVKYIHLNPLRAGIVRSIAELEEYPWTGHGKIVHGGDPKWQDLSLLRTEFHDADGGSRWITAYCDHIQKTSPDDPEKGKIVSPRNPFDTEEGSPAVLSGPRDAFSRTLHCLAASHGVPVEEVAGGSRKYHVVQVRREVLKKCKSELGVSIAQLAHWLGMKENAAAYLLKSGRMSRKNEE
jgi:REP element-mobilizing transposase RayT